MTKAQDSETIIGTRILPLPSQSTSCVVQYEPALKVSCLIPGGRRRLQFLSSEGDGYEDKWVMAPRVWISHWIFDEEGLFEDDECFSIWRAKSSNLTKIKGDVVPHGGGEVCWGDVLVPNNLKEANTRYWATIFHEDFYRNKDCYWRNLDDEILGEKYLRLPKTKYVLISDESKIMTHFPAKYWVETTYGDYLKDSHSQLVIAPVSCEENSKDSLQVTFGSKSFLLKKEKV